MPACLRAVREPLEAATGCAACGLAAASPPVPDLPGVGCWHGGRCPVKAAHFVGVFLGAAFAGAVVAFAADRVLWGGQ